MFDYKLNYKIQHNIYNLYSIIHSINYKTKFITISTLLEE